MAYQLEARDSQYWLNTHKKPSVGPGAYEGANAT